MSELCEIKAIVRTDAVPELVRALKGAGITRFFVSRIHALGAGVDPERFRMSLTDEGGYTEKAKVEFVCEVGRCDELSRLVHDTAGTGHRGDGVVIVTPVRDVMSVRTGEHDSVALL